MQKNKGKRLAFEMLFALLLFLLLVAILVTETARARDTYFYERADLVSYTKSDALCGYVFRNEIAAETWNNGPIDYRVPNGTHVKAGTELAHVYRDDSATDKRERAAALYEQIAELEASLTVSDWKNTYISEYAALMRELSAGNTVTALSPAQSTATAIGGRDAQKDSAPIQARIASLQAELDALTAHTSDYRATTADADGVFYHKADGYEALFGINQIEQLTPEALHTLLAAPPKLDAVIGKLVCHGPWYLAVPTERALAETYTAGSSYPVHFQEGCVTMTLERIYTDDTDTALLIFYSAEAPVWLSPERQQSVTVEKERITALCIPADALSDDNTLFVLHDGVARIRHVTPVLREQGCQFVLPAEENGLAQGERVIVSTKQLFDGKVLK